MRELSQSSTKRSILAHCSGLSIRSGTIRGGNGTLSLSLSPGELLASRSEKKSPGESAQSIRTARTLPNLVAKLIYPARCSESAKSTFQCIRPFVSRYPTAARSRLGRNDNWTKPFRFPARLSVCAMKNNFSCHQYLAVRGLTSAPIPAGECQNSNWVLLSLIKITDSSLNSRQGGDTQMM